MDRRQVEGHRVDDTDRVRVEAEQQGRYRITGFDGGPNVALQFQEGDPTQVGTNGITPAHLVAAAADRLRTQADGDKTNAAALKHLDAALKELTDASRAERQRTRDQSAQTMTPPTGASKADAKADRTPDATTAARR